MVWPKGKKHTEETRRKISETLIRRIEAGELTESIAVVGRKHTAEEKRKVSAAMKEHYRKERMRVRWGLPQKTNLRIYGSSRIKVCARSRFRQKGYIVERASNTLYYDENTKRCEPMEKRAKGKYGLTILPLPQDNN